MNLNVGDTLHGFSVQTGEDLSEIDGSAHTLLHNKSGAKLLYLKNDDSNKSFSIAFRTPPADDTGVFHILEHSVLCGSDKFPVKEPFVDLLKSSMQTFLNAMTFPDKTMYPVASTNEQDLLNLMDVYLDAVLHPAIYQKRTIFEQEGWHYELRDDSEAAEGDSVVGDAVAATEGADGSARLVFNGVVYNEMKGALSDPNSVLYDELQAALLPDTAYRFESGGIPRAILDLTYEHFLEEHQRHYRLDNSYLTLYGNLDIERVLGFLDEHYLSPVADEQKARDLERIEAGLTPLLPRELTLQKPLVSSDVVKQMATSPENACTAVGYVIGDARDRTRLIAVDILLDALFGSNETPVKRALLDENLGDDVQAFLADSLLQPFVVVQVRGALPDAAQRLRGALEKALRTVAEAGIDRRLIEASLSRAEFIFRERDFGVADGVAFSMAALSGWLYDDELATAYLRYENDFAFLRQALDNNYFEQLINQVFLESNHTALVEVRPTDGDDEAYEAERLAAAAATMTADDFVRVAEEEALLRRMQTEPDSPHALATLPRLSISDLDDMPDEARYELDTTQPLPCLRHYIPTHGIVYTYRYFDLNSIPFEDLPYVSLLSLVMGKLGTASHSAAELDTLVNGKLGSLSFFPEIYEDDQNTSKVIPKFVVGASALSENISALNNLPLEVMLTTDFSDTSKIKDVLQQRRIGMEQSFANAGHSAAMGRVSSYYLPAGVIRNQLGGVDFYRFIKDLLTHFDERASALSGRLSTLATRLFQDARCLISFTGSDEDFAQFWSNDVLTGRTSEEKSALIAPEPVVRNEAFIVSTDVCYTAQGFDRRLLDAPYSGAWQVVAKALSFDYLWNEVRVKGGAYGAGFQTSRAGSMRFYSYRDPHLDETYQRFSKAVSWLASFNPDKAAMEGYVVSTVAGLDAPVKARVEARRQDGTFIAGRSPELRKQAREEVIATTTETIRPLADTLAHALDKGAICVFGNRDILENAKANLTLVDLLNEE